MVKIEKDVLQKVFDTAVHSMDFGSGFLDNEEVDALRTCAVILDVDVDEATPYNFKKQYGLMTAAERQEAERCPSKFDRLRCTINARANPEHLHFCWSGNQWVGGGWVYWNDDGYLCDTDGSVSKVLTLPQQAAQKRNRALIAQGDT